MSLLSYSKQVFIFLLATSQLHAQDNIAKKFAERITPASLQAHLRVIASPDMQGRATGTAGQRKAAAYIESEFRKAGLRPGNGNSYEQVYPLYSHDLATATFVVNGKEREEGLDYSFAVQAAWYNTQHNFSSIHLKAANIIFAGYGMVDTSYQVNDYAGLDVKGKIVLVLENAPPGYPAPLYHDGVNHSTDAYKIQFLRSRGAAGLIIAGNGFRQAGLASEAWVDMRKPIPGAGFSLTKVSPELALTLLGKTGKTNEMSGLKHGAYAASISIDIEVKTIALQGSNIVGVLEGTDKKDEYVFMTAHYDHVGRSGSDIYYGADDNGSGTAAVLQMAAAFSAAAKEGSRPRRTMVFMTVSGEELGLLGSEYFTGHPLFPMQKISVDLNTDMIGRVDPQRQLADSLNYLYVVGHDQLSSGLDSILEVVNDKSTQLVLDYKFDSPTNPERLFYRSDHYNFARKGVPVLFFTDGMLQDDYHQPTDTVDKINFELMAKRARLIFYTGWELANRDSMLRRDLLLK